MSEADLMKKFDEVLMYSTRHDEHLKKINGTIQRHEKTIGKIWDKIEANEKESDRVFTKIWEKIDDEGEKLVKKIDWNKGQIMLAMGGIAVFGLISIALGIVVSLKLIGVI